MPIAGVLRECFAPFSAIDADRIQPRHHAELTISNNAFLLRIGAKPCVMIAPVFSHGTDMKSIRLFCFSLFCLAFFGNAAASDFEAALSSETAQFTFRSDSSVIGWGGSDLALGLFYNEDSDFIFQASLLQMRQPS